MTGPSRLILRSVVAPHGITDLWETTDVTRVLRRYAFALAATCALPVAARAAALLVGSVHHISRDFDGLPRSGRYAASVGVHAFWCACPRACLPYLACLHTPLHYRRVHLSCPRRPRVAIGAAVAVLTLATYGLGDAIEAWCLARLGPLWWVAPVCAHVSLVGDR